MENIIEPNIHFDFSKITLAHPITIQGGAYFTRIEMNKKPLYIQTLKSLTKQGIIKSGKKHYCDLLFDNTSAELINWFENLEDKCHKLIYEKKDEWFQGNLEENDVESAFSPIMRIYKSGKFYLLRTNLKNTKDNQPILRIYDENENILTTTDINNETEIISILEIQGIKFTSRNFQLEIEVKQMMVINNEPIFESCLIKTNTPKKIQPNQEENSIALEHLANNDLENNDVENNVLENNDLANNHLETIDNIVDNSNDTTDVLEEIEPLPENSLEMDLENQSLEKNDLSNNLDMSSNEEIIDISFEELATIPNNDDELTEVDYFNFNLEDDHTVKLRPPNEVYFDLYKEAREKAKQAKKNAILAYLEAKNIRKTYMIDYIDESDGDADFDAEIDDVSESELEGL
jgi:hypothetical protein